MTTTIKTLRKLGVLVMLTLAFVSCEKEDIKETVASGGNANLETEQSEFDFDEFGRAHNDYLSYVHGTGIGDKRERFEFGKSYVDPVFGSFDVGIDYEKLVQGMPAHMRKVDAIVAGTYNAQGEEGISPKMKRFLNELSQLTAQSVAADLTIGEFVIKLEDLEDRVKATQEINIDLVRGKSNDGASMLAITSILKYSVQYWAGIDGVGGDDIPKAKLWDKIKRGLADAWGYVSAWTNNGDGSYSWDHGSALVNADCHSDQVYEN